MRVKQNFFIILSFFVTLIIVVIPFPNMIQLIMPEWVVLCLIYWIIQSQIHINIGAAWVLGLILDALSGTTLGEHALALTLVAYICVRLKRQFPYYPLSQQSLFILVLLLIYRLILFIIEALTHHVMTQWLYWVAPLIASLCWPFVYLILQKYQLRFTQLRRI